MINTVELKQELHTLKKERYEVNTELAALFAARDQLHLTIAEKEAVLTEANRLNDIELKGRKTTTIMTLAHSVLSTDDYDRLMNAWFLFVKNKDGEQ